MIYARAKEKRPEFTAEILSKAQSIAYRTLADKSQAEDAVQLAALAIVRNGYPVPYIFKLVHFVSMTLNKKYRQHERLQRTYQPRERAAHEKTRQLLNESVREDQPRVVMQLKMDGYTFEEIRERLQLSERVVRDSYRKAVHDLKRDE